MIPFIISLLGFPFAAANPDVSDGGAGSGIGIICPQAPPGAEGIVATILSYFSWAAVTVLVAGGVVSVILIVVGKVLNMGRLATAGFIGLFVLIAGAIIYLAFPSLMSGLLGTGCTQA